MRSIVSLILAWAMTAAPAIAGDVYRLDKATPLPGKSPGWDYVSLDGARQRLFIGRRDDGLLVVDLKTRKALTTIKDSAHANAAVLIPSLDRGYTANEDGTTTIFRLSDLGRIDRKTFGTDADAVFFDPATGQVIFTMGNSHALAFLDAASGASTGRLDLDSAKLESIVADGAGLIYVPERDRDRVAKVDARDHRLIAEWTTGPCAQPTGQAIDREGHRLFIGCRGQAPVLLVMNMDTGAIIASLPIGRGNDGVVYDPATRKIITANGLDANVVVYEQVDADTYKLDHASTTRPNARTLAYDAGSKAIHLVTAEGWVDPGKKINSAVAPFYPNAFDAKSFVLLTYRLRPARAGAEED